jgi:Fic family protein
VIRREPLYRDQAHKDKLEGRNARLLYRRVLELIPVSRGQGKDDSHELRLTTEIIKDLHQYAIQDIYSCAGQFRTWRVRIAGSQHMPPDWIYVESSVDSMCNTVNEHSEWDPLHTTAFLLWRLNWIHPFGGGNGRTSRAVAYLGLCARLGFIPPGKQTITQYIDENRSGHINALRDADKAWLNSSTIDVGIMQSFLDDWLKKQLANFSTLNG